MASKRQGNELWRNWSAMQHVCPTAPLCNTCRESERASAAGGKSRRLLFRRHCPSAYITLTKQQRRGESERERERPRAHHFTCLLVKCQRLSAVKRFSLSLFVCCRGSAAPLFVIFLLGGGGMGAASCDDDSSVCECL